MTAPLKDRLRAMYSHRGDGIPTQHRNPDGEEAADYIEKLEAELAALRPAPVDPRIAVAREILRRAMLAIGDGCAAAAWAEDEPVSERDRLVAEALAACLPPGMTIDDLPPVKGEG